MAVMINEAFIGFWQSRAGVSATIKGGRGKYETNRGGFVRYRNHGDMLEPNAHGFCRPGGEA